MQNILAVGPLFDFDLGSVHNSNALSVQRSESEQGTTIQMMTLHGVDIYIWSPTTPEVPKSHGKLTLALISNRGTRIYPGPAPDMDLLDWPRCRFLSDEVVSDAEIDALVQHLSGQGFTWTKCQKLFRKDGVDQFSQPY